jgi:hypothetical protein
VYGVLICDEADFGSYKSTYWKNLMNLNFLLKMEAGGSAETPSNRIRHIEEYNNFELLLHSPLFNVYVSTYILCMHIRTNVCMYLTFRGPCIVIYSYNKNQKDALFLNCILVKNSTCFGQTNCPSSRALILYSQQLYCGKELYMFRTDLLSIISSLNTVITATGIWESTLHVSDRLTVHHQES